MNSTIEDEYVATLVHPDEYAKNVSQIASISTRRLVFVKRREFALKPFELLEFPTSACTAVKYRERFALIPMFAGLLLVALVVFILTSDVAPGTRVPVGALAVLVVLGATLLAGPRRHELTFTVAGADLKWRSKAGDYMHKRVSVQKVVAWARGKGLLHEGGAET